MRYHRIVRYVFSAPSLAGAFVVATALSTAAGRAHADAVRIPAVQCVPVAQGPTIDGDGADDAWAAAPVHTLLAEEVVPGLEATKLPIELRAVYTEEQVFFLVSWPDATHDDGHKTWVWNAASDRYDAGEDREDVVVLAFPISGPFTANMLSGDEAVWDVWQWKAARTNPAGFAMDKRHLFTRAQPAGKAKSFPTLDGTDIWIARPEDGGTSPEGKQAAPAAHAGDRVPQYVPQTPTGSAADIRAKGRWHDGRWTVEFQRALDTGHGDDASFLSHSRPARHPAPRSAQPPPHPRSILFSVAVFDREEHADHSTTGRLELQFVPRATAGS